MQQAPQHISAPVTFRPTLEQEEILTALIETRKYSNSSEAMQWLLREGIASKREYINEIVQIYKEIERLRRQVQQTGAWTACQK